MSVGESLRVCVCVLPSNVADGDALGQVGAVEGHDAGVSA